MQQIKNQATPNYDGLIEQGAEILRFYSTLKQKIVQPQDCLTLLPQAMREELERSFVLDNDISLAEGLGINHFALFSIDRHVDNVQIHLGILYQAKQAAQKNRKID
ncbi:MAG: hypothetical protein HY069_03205 [Chlamydiia bacterium]|nr:hypothetical protein [Chlamydiia bacterium]